MSTEAKACAATTKAGAPCKNTALPGSDYCRIHAAQSTATVPTAATVTEPTPPQAASEAQQVELRELAKELNALALELQKLVPSYSPPPYSPQGLRTLLDQVLERLAPEQRRHALNALRDMFEGTSIDDFRDIETWKGMWFTLNYLVSTEAATRRDWLMERLARLPGMDTVSGVREMLASTPPQEFLNPETWKGIWFIVNYEVQNQATSLRRRFFGGAAGDEDAPAGEPESPATEPVSGA